MLYKLLLIFGELMKISGGKPADYGLEIIKRRFRLTRDRVKLEGKIILDFGSGSGAQTVEFANSNCTIYALDVNSESLEVLKNISINEKLENIHTINYNGDIIPLKTSSIDLVISYEVLEHVESENDSLSELYRVLKPGGEMIFSVPNKWWIFETHGAFLPMLPWNRVPFFSWLPKFIHSKYAKARIYTRRSIKRIFENNGFSILNINYITAPMDVIKNRLIKKILRKTIFSGDETNCPFKSTAILIHIKKYN